MSMINKVKDTRIERGLTQEELARELNISQRHLQRIEANVSIPNVYLALLLSVKLYKSVTDIFII